MAIATPAFATPLYDVSVGGNTTSADYFLEAAASPVDMVPHGVHGDAPWDCVESTVSGEVHGGPSKAGIEPDHIATVADVAWQVCTWWLGLELRIEHRAPWRLNVTATDTTPAPPADSDASAYLSDVAFYIYAVNDESGCSFTVSGGMTAYLDEVEQQLVVDEDGTNPDGHDLAIDVADGDTTCFGLITDGDPFSLSANYDLYTFGAGPIDIAPAS